MGDDDARRLRRLQLVHAFSHDAHGIHVEAGVRLVEDTQLRFEHSHLEYLVALLLTTTEALVHRAVGQLRVQLHDLTLLALQLQEFGTLHRLQALSLALLVDGRLHEVGHRHTGNLHGILEREEQSLVGPVLRLHLQQVLAVEPSLALRHLVERIAHEHCRECRLPRAVGAHDSMRLPVVDHEVDALQYFLLANSGVQVSDF